MHLNSIIKTLQNSPILDPHLDKRQSEHSFIPCTPSFLYSLSAILVPPTMSSELVGGEIFHRFKWVVPGRLARSSAPYYQGKDSHQKIDDAAVRVLGEYGIRNIISLNSHSLTQNEIDQLGKAGIAYTHIGLPDFSAPTLSQFATMNSVYKSVDSGATLVWCGYGHGRTGTVITALQMYGGRLPMSHDDYRENHVETQAQVNVLDELQRTLNQCVSSTYCTERFSPRVPDIRVR